MAHLEHPSLSASFFCAFPQVGGVMHGDATLPGECLSLKEVLKRLIYNRLHEINLLHSYQAAEGHGLRTQALK